MSSRLLDVEGLSIEVDGTPLVRDVSFSIDAGQRLGIIGESGSGKTITALSIMGLLAENLVPSGRIVFDDRNLLDLDEQAMSSIRGNAISMIFQEPMTALNPVMRVGKQVVEALRRHEGIAKSDAMTVATELLDRVGIDQPDRRARSFPHELSGGQRQRAMIAMALACGPQLVVADEPTTALDVTVQAQVLQVLRDQVVSNDAALILITHDLPVVASITNDVIVMRDGYIVESGRTAHVFGSPSNSYTAQLVDSVPPMSRAISAPAKPPSNEPESDAIVDINHLRKTYRLRRTSIRDSPPMIHAVDDVSLKVHEGETFGIVGESGSGKSTLARMMVGLTKPTEGDISVAGIDVSGTKNLRPLRDVVQMVFQDPMGSLDPRMKIGDIVAEPLRSLGHDGDHRSRVRSLLDAVAMPADVLDRYPHEFSGGQRQRIAIARALAPGPRLLVADEPVSALDMSVQTVTLDLLRNLKEQFDLTLVFISHDLSVVHEICERVIVLDGGRIVEQGPVGTVFGNPKETYTQQLVAAIPRLDGAVAATGSALNVDRPPPS